MSAILTDTTVHLHVLKIRNDHLLDFPSEDHEKSNGWFTLFQILMTVF